MLSLTLKWLHLLRKAMLSLSGECHHSTITPLPLLLGTLVILSFASMSLVARLTGAPVLVMGLESLLTLQGPHHNLYQY